VFEARKKLVTSLDRFSSKALRAVRVLSVADTRGVVELLDGWMRLQTGSLDGCAAVG
jgi:hypothetical protein